MSKTFASMLFLVLFHLPSLGSCQGALIAEQQEIIGVLSGEREGPNGVWISNRSSSANRERSREYLLSLIEGVGGEGQLQSYEMPNLNPLIDLLFSPYTGANVYGILPATTPSADYVLLGAHFDSEMDCPGAIDNGSGVALIYSVFKQLSSLPSRKKNVILVFFDQEEEDLVGSQAFAKYCRKNKLKLHSVHTFDTIGWDGDGDRAVELELPTPDLEQQYKSVAARLSIPVHVTRVNSTDHHSFRLLGYDAIGLTDEYANGDYAPYKDTPDDTYDTVNFEFLASCTQLVFETIKDIVEND